MAKILVVEDETTVLENILEILELEGYETVGAPNGRAGIEQARMHRPDLILCDIMMPELTGYEVLLRLRADPATSMIPLIFLTAKADRAAMRRGMELGADDYITKPFNSEELLSAVKTRLERQAALAREYENRLEELRGSISYILPHELRTPLTSILGYSEILMTDGHAMNGNAIVEAAELIHSAGLRLHRLIKNFLIYAQAEIMRLDPARIETLRRFCMEHPKARIEDVVFQKAQVFAREADLTTEIQDVEGVRVVIENLNKIVEELADNAFKFSMPGTPVHVAAGVKGREYLLRIKNHGHGLTPEQIASIGAYAQFERRLYEQQGVGLGLAIAKLLTELHGGSLTIESVPGQDVTVQVALPLC